MFKRWLRWREFEMATTVMQLVLPSYLMCTLQIEMATSFSSWTNFRELIKTKGGSSSTVFWLRYFCNQNNFLASFIPVRELIKRFSTPLFTDGTHQVLFLLSTTISLLQNIKL